MAVGGGSNREFDLEQIKPTFARAGESLFARFNLKITGDTIDRMREESAAP